jgi:hypothetical protein
MPTVPELLEEIKNLKRVIIHGPTMTIGKYHISHGIFEGDKLDFWISKDDGEGMQISTEKLNAWLDKMWYEEF